MQSKSTREDVFDTFEDLTQHKANQETVPNCVHALIGGYGAWNVHMPSDGSGYRFLTDQLLRLNTMNPQVAAKFLQIEDWKLGNFRKTLLYRAK